MRRLLIVEDEADIATSLCLLLAHAEVRIEVAADGAEAIAKARKIRPHLILLDVRLPCLDGFEVFRIVRRDPTLRATRVIFLSAHADPAELARASEHGAHGWFRKPFHGGLLRRKILEALGVDEVDPACAAAH